MAYHSPKRRGKCCSEHASKAKLFLAADLLTLDKRADFTFQVQQETSDLAQRAPRKERLILLETESRCKAKRDFFLAYIHSFHGPQNYADRPGIRHFEP